MNLYMATYNKEYLTKTVDGECWCTDTRSNHTFIIIAEDLEDAKEKVQIALDKVNKYAEKNQRYVLETNARKIVATAITHDISMGTNITGIWD